MQRDRIVHKISVLTVTHKTQHFSQNSIIAHEYLTIGLRLAFTVRVRAFLVGLQRVELTWHVIPNATTFL